MEIGYKSFRIFMGKYTGERPGGSPENPNDDDDGAYKETSSEQKINIWRGRTVEVISRACVSEVVRMKPPQAYLCVVYSTGAAHMQRDSFHAKLCRSIKKRRRSINDSLFLRVHQQGQCFCRVPYITPGRRRPTKCGRKNTAVDPEKWRKVLCIIWEEKPSPFRSIASSRRSPSHHICQWQVSVYIVHHRARCCVSASFSLSPFFFSVYKLQTIGGEVD